MIVFPPIFAQGPMTLKIEAGTSTSAFVAKASEVIQPCVVALEIGGQTVTSRKINNRPLRLYGTEQKYDAISCSGDSLEKLIANINYKMDIPKTGFTGYGFNNGEVDGSSFLREGTSAIGGYRGAVKTETEFNSKCIFQNSIDTGGQVKRLAVGLLPSLFRDWHLQIPDVYRSAYVDIKASNCSVQFALDSIAKALSGQFKMTDGDDVLTPVPTLVRPGLAKWLRISDGPSFKEKDDMISELIMESPDFQLSAIWSKPRSQYDYDVKEAYRNISEELRTKMEKYVRANPVYQGSLKNMDFSKPFAYFSPRRIPLLGFLSTAENSMTFI